MKDIVSIKNDMGGRLCIMAHHYQADDVVRHADILGDSLELARRLDGLQAEHIVFCGVHFMAETAAILARPGQKVHIPDSGASCVMADMVPAELAELVLRRLQSGGAKIIPLTYVNSSAAVKAVCGRHGGSVCTSANATTMLSWAMDQGDGVLFLPDANLGHNTARQLGIDPAAILRLNIRGQGAFIDPADAGHSLYLWPGLCAVHAKFKTQQIEQARSAHPGASVLVHPECHPSVVAMADGAGSTSFLIKEVEAAPAGSVIYVGTEWNLVNRLRARHTDKDIRPLYKALCSNMCKITEPGLKACLNTLDQAEPEHVDEEIAVQAKVALERMLDACR